MQRILSLCLMALFFWVTATANNTIGVSSTQGHPGDEVDVKVTLSGNETPTAVEVQIALDKALQYVEGSATLNAERSNGHSLTAAAKDGQLSIVIYSPTLAPLQGTSGELCSFRLKLGKEPASYTLNPTVLMSDGKGNTIQATASAGTVTLLSPKIEVVTPTIDFGHIPIRQAYTQYLGLRNTGNEPLVVSAITTDRTDLAVKEQSHIIEPGSTKQVELTYLPTVRGAMETTVSITSNAVNSRAGTAKVVADPFSVNELHVQRAEGVSDEEVTVVLKMNNMEPIAGAQCTFNLPNELDYVEGSAAAGSRCSETGHTVSGVVQGKNLTLLLYSNNNATLPEGDGELMTFRVRLKGYSGSYRLSPKDVVLSNVAMENMVSATSANDVIIRSPRLNAENNMKFEDIPVAQESSAVYTLRNYGEIDLVISKVMFLDEGYTITEELPIRISAWESANLTVKTTPQAEGTFSTKMQVYSNDPQNRMHSVDISGNAYEDNRLTINGRNTEEGYQFTFGLENYSNVVALQMNLKWDAGMTTATNMLKPTERLKNHNVVITEIGNGYYQVLVYSMNNSPIEGHSGDLFSLEYKAAPNTDYRNSTLEVEDILFSNTNGENKSKMANQQAVAAFTHYWLSFVLDGELISRTFVEQNSNVTYPQIADRTGYHLVWDQTLEAMPANDITVNGSWIVNQYTITFDTDGGSEVAPITQAYGSEVTAPAAPTKEGHTFAGWDKDIPATMPAQNITIKALWTVNQYTITFDTDGGSEVAPITQAYGSEVTAPAVPTKEGHTFAGWDKEIPATMPAQDMTVKALWTVNQYTITFDTDGGSEIAPITQTYGSEVTAPAAPTKEGHTFAGWDKEIPATMPAQDITIKALWTVNQYTITFDTDGGSEVAPITQAYGSEVTAPTAPTKEGHTFAGWDKEIPATMPAQDITIKALWTVNQYTITFDTDGGSEVAPITQAYGSEVTAPAVPTKEGHTFAGWDKEIPATMPAQNMTVKALWTVNQYTITFDTDGGSEIVPITQAYGSEVTAPATPTKEGHTFAGWDKEIPATMPAQNITVKALWTVNQYTITFMDGDVVISSEKLDYNSRINVPEPLGREGYTFIGWTPDIPESVPATDLTFYAGYEVNYYTITYYINGEEVYSEEIAYGEHVEEYIPVIDEGFEFKGWQTEIPKTMPAHDVDIYGTAEVADAIDLPNAERAKQLKVYTIDGKYVTTVMEIEQTKRLPKGLYLINGKKVVVR